MHAFIYIYIYAVRTCVEESLRRVSVTSPCPPLLSCLRPVVVLRTKTYSQVAEAVTALMMNALVLAGGGERSSAVSRRGAWRKERRAAILRRNEENRRCTSEEADTEAVGLEECSIRIVCGT